MHLLKTSILLRACTQCNRALQAKAIQMPTACCRVVKMGFHFRQRVKVLEACRTGWTVKETSQPRNLPVRLAHMGSFTSPVLASEFAK